MEFLFSAFKSPFTWGLLLGLLFTGISVWSHLKSLRELRRYKRHLSDKLEIEADQHSGLRAEKEKLAKENENLRIKIGSGRDGSNRELQRELEILSRAEKTMILNAPGFAPAWETAKSAAMDEISGEEQGKSLPRKIFRKFVKSGSEGSEETKALPDPDDARESEVSKA